MVVACAEGDHVSSAVDPIVAAASGVDLVCLGSAVDTIGAVAAGEVVFTVPERDRRGAGGGYRRHVVVAGSCVHGGALAGDADKVVPGLGKHPRGASGHDDVVVGGAVQSPRARCSDNGGCLAKALFFGGRGIVRSA